MMIFKWYITWKFLAHQLLTIMYLFFNIVSNYALQIAEILNRQAIFTKTFITT